MAGLSSQTDSEIVCANGHKFPLIGDNYIPAFAFQAENVNEYSIRNAANIHDKSLEWLFAAHHTNEGIFRHEVLSKLNLKKGQRVLVTGVGAGNDLPYICEKIGIEGEIFAQDFSQQMLFSAVDRVQNKFGLSDYTINFSLSDAVNLPYPKEYFDTVYHFGGLNIFSDIPKGILEMDRVVKNGGTVVMGDEGLAPWLKSTEIGEMLTTNNPLYVHNIPLEHLPENSRDVQVNWTINNCYYVISYTSSKSPLKIDIDLPHAGTRGGTLRKRHLGILEGVDVDLKREIYEAAKAANTSRVDFLENLLQLGLAETIKDK